MRHITQEGIDLIKRFEGFSPTVYFCPAGYEDFSGGITQGEAEELLRLDAQIAERAVLRLITVPLTDGQFDALVSFTYNLGSGALQRSIMRWVWAGGRKLRGLVRRREAESVSYNL